MGYVSNGSVHRGSSAGRHLFSLPKIVLFICILGALIAGWSSYGLTLGINFAKKMHFTKIGFETTDSVQCDNLLEEGKMGAKSARSPSAMFKAWVEEGIANASLTYALGVAPFPLPEFLHRNDSFPVGCTSPATSATDGRFRVLIFGDSIDRFLLEDGCGLSGGRQPAKAQWTKNFTYLTGAPASLVCEYPQTPVKVVPAKSHHNPLPFWISSNTAPVAGTVSNGGIVAFLNVYGSTPRGPYYENHGSHSEFSGDTVERVNEGVRQFVEEFGGPLDAILFRAEVWDMHKHAPKVENGALTGDDLAAVFPQFVSDLGSVFQDLRERFPRAILGTHTVPFPIKKSRLLFFSYLSALRLFTRRSEDIFLLDWNALLGPLEPSVTQKDAMHPDGKYSGPFYALLAGAIQRWFSHCPREAAT